MARSAALAPRLPRVRRHWLTPPVALAGAAVLAVLVPLAPPLALLGLAALGALALATLERRLVSLALGALVVLLAGYAFFSRGFAWVGVPPLFIGEPVLALLLLAVMAWRAPGRLGWPHAGIAVFMLWGLARTLPFLPRDGIDAARDSVVWLYALFAIAVSLLMTRQRFEHATELYGRVLLVFAIWVPIAGLLHLMGILRFAWPGAPTPLLTFKAGDMAVHLAGIAAFVSLGLYAGGRGQALRESLLWPAWAAGAVFAMSANRGGMLALLMTTPLAFLAMRSSRRLTLLVSGAAVLAVVVMVNPSLPTPRGRDVSLAGVAANALSIFVNAEESDREGTKEWRLEWWGEIVDYTIRGPYPLGKGFGVNLADSDGFQTDGTLRSPHNIHMTVLARMGLPGLVLWLALQGAFGAALLRAWRRARRRGDEFWASVNVWLLVYWAAMLTNASFDVYIEGPQGGVWFWTVMGLGIAALRIQREERASAPDGDGDAASEPAGRLAGAAPRRSG